MREKLDYVIVGLAAVEAAQPALASLEDRLSAPDRERAGRFLRTEDRTRFVLGRGLLSSLLRDELDHRPSVLDLAFTDLRRPYLAAHPSVTFSITHAGGWVAVAVAVGARVGIDIESVDRRVDLDPLAERIFNGADLARFRALSMPEKPRAFFRGWTGKEAVLKAKGLGISGGVREIAVPFASDTPVTFLEPDGAGVVAWRLEPLPFSDAHLGAVAWDNPEKKAVVRRLSAADLL
jgi:4'-phosphopantetheinyl transferase